jgi:hypothetical protein
MPPNGRRLPSRKLKLTSKMGLGRSYNFPMGRRPSDVVGFSRSNEILKVLQSMKMRGTLQLPGF